MLGCKTGIVIVHVCYCIVLCNNLCVNFFLTVWVMCVHRYVWERIPTFHSFGEQRSSFALFSVLNKNMQEI